MKICLREPSEKERDKGFFGNGERERERETYVQNFKSSLCLLLCSLFFLI